MIGRWRDMRGLRGYFKRKRRGRMRLYRG